jgi:hypothetical protein
MEDNKGFSIITNFGCYRNCYYCIWKTHKLKDVRQDTDWNKLEGILEGLRVDKVSISGGGDPLYMLNQNKNWYKKLFGICSRIGLLIDIHTYELTFNQFILDNINKYVLHTDRYRISYEKALIEKLSKHTKLRINFVITDEYTKEDLLSYIEFAKKLDIQISFRELVGSFSKPSEDIVSMLDKVQEVYDRARFTKQDDYNIYFMPDNNIYNTFLI